MQTKAILFDLDGTLLPMDQDVFIKAYFGGLVKALAPHGYAPDAIVNAIWAGTKAMIQNDGSKANEAAFWDCFCDILGPEAQKTEPILEKFYANEFQQVQQVCGFAPESAQIVRDLKSRGFRVILATNPIFPAIATHSRIRWAGLEPEDFELVTTYENCRFSKPTPAYYQQILAQAGLAPAECVMVGNDVGDDMVAEHLGCKVFLLTNDLINSKNADITRWPRGSFAELRQFLSELVG